MSSMDRLVLPFKAVHQLGLEPVAYNAFYRFELAVGHYRRVTPVRPILPDKRWSLSAWIADTQRSDVLAPVRRFYRAHPEVQAAIIEQADEICAGQMRFFGGDSAPLRLELPGPPDHWTAYETRRAHWDGDPDIKYIWEPGRFSWAYTLARAFTLTGNEGYAQFFWQHTETFLNANPPNLGPHWMSAQEVALRLAALLFCGRVFAQSLHTTPERLAFLAAAAAAHAARIPPTLIYARSQNNNHLISEALGLFAAGVALAENPAAAIWKDLGWFWLNQALQTQIAADGEYCQHSANYHRLMLQEAQFAQALAIRAGLTLPDETREALLRATAWLHRRMDFTNGRVPNLGHNDGSYVFPLAPGGIEDYRPVVEACGAFSGLRELVSGVWDELSLWMQQLAGKVLWRDEFPGVLPVLPPEREPILTSVSSWACLTAEHYTTRPAHADQLHVDLWWRGENVAQDAGTFSYNAPPPWQNALAATIVHNTLMLDDQDQMTRAGRFLWLDWAQARILDPKPGEGPSTAAEHTGYRRLGVIHRRVLSNPGLDQWRVLDTLLPCRWPRRIHQVWLHWLLPDGEWELDGAVLRVRLSPGWITLRVTIREEKGHPAPPVTAVQLVRAGELISGEGGFSPLLGWVSPNYGLKIPALSLRVLVSAKPPFSLLSEWSFSTRK